MKNIEFKALPNDMAGDTGYENFKKMKSAIAERDKKSSPINKFLGLEATSFDSQRRLIPYFQSQMDALNKINPSPAEHNLRWNWMYFRDLFKELARLREEIIPTEKNTEKVSMVIMDRSEFTKEDTWKADSPEYNKKPKHTLVREELNESVKDQRDWLQTRIAAILYEIAKHEKEFKQEYPDEYLKLMEYKDLNLGENRTN